MNRSKSKIETRNGKRNRKYTRKTVGWVGLGYPYNLCLICALLACVCTSDASCRAAGGRLLFDRIGHGVVHPSKERNRPDRDVAAYAGGRRVLRGDGVDAGRAEGGELHIQVAEGKPTDFSTGRPFLGTRNNFELV